MNFLEVILISGSKKFSYLMLADTYTFFKSTHLFLYFSYLKQYFFHIAQNWYHISDTNISVIEMPANNISCRYINQAVSLVFTKMYLDFFSIHLELCR